MNILEEFLNLPAPLEDFPRSLLIKIAITNEWDYEEDGTLFLWDGDAEEYPCHKWQHILRNSETSECWVCNANTLWINADSINDAKNDRAFLELINI